MSKTIRLSDDQKIKKDKYDVKSVVKVEKNCKNNFKYDKTTKTISSDSPFVFKRNTTHSTSADLNLAQLIEMWIESNEIRLKGGTKCKYVTLIETHIAPQLGSMNVSDITSSVINRFLNDKLTNGRLDGKGGLSPSYVRSLAYIITSALNYAVMEGLCLPLNSKINKPCNVKSDLKILSLENQKILELEITKTLTPTHIGIFISLYTGLRIGEVCALRWEDVNLIEKTIYVRHTVSRIRSEDNRTKTRLILDSPKTTSSKRVVPIPSRLLSALETYRHISVSDYLISTSESFVSPRTYEERFCKVLKSCHLEKMNYHALRHTFATRCIEAGVDIKSLSEILGHANVSTTLNTYVHSSLEMKKHQINKLSVFLS